MKEIISSKTKYYSKIHSSKPSSASSPVRTDKSLSGVFLEIGGIQEISPKILKNQLNSPKNENFWPFSDNLR